jgi:hypothetical protein
MSDALSGDNHPNYGKPRPAGAVKPSKVIEVFDLKENTTTYYNSIREAAIALNILSRMSIHYSLKTGKAYKKRYILTKL